VRDRQPALYLLAVLWHFGHDVVGYNIGRLLGAGGAYAWLAFIAIAYTFFILWMRRFLTASEPLKEPVAC